MKGTEKQIEWAEDIKSAAIRTCEGNIRLAQEAIEKYHSTNKRDEITIAVYTEIKATLEKVFKDMDDAARIINIRHKYASATINQIAEVEIEKRVQVYRTEKEAAETAVESATEKSENTVKVVKDEKEIEMAYDDICKDLGFAPENRFIKITNDGAVTFNGGKPEQIRGLWWEAGYKGYKISSELDDAVRQ